MHADAPINNNKTAIYGPLEISLNALRGLRYINGDDGAYVVPGSEGTEKVDENPADDKQEETRADDKQDDKNPDDAPADDQQVDKKDDDEDTGSQDDQEDDQQADEKVDDTKKPEDEDSFTLEDATKLIGNLRKDKAYWKGKNTANLALLNAAKADADKHANRVKELEAAETARSQRSKKIEILTAEGLPENYVVYLLGDKESEWKKHAETLAADRSTSTTPKGSNVRTAGRDGKKTEDEIVASYKPTGRTF